VLSRKFYVQNVKDTKCTCAIQNDNPAFRTADVSIGVLSDDRLNPKLMGTGNTNNTHS
jgi:hypothetical protein